MDLESGAENGEPFADTKQSESGTRRRPRIEADAVIGDGEGLRGGQPPEADLEAVNGAEGQLGRQVGGGELDGVGGHFDYSFGRG